MPGSPAIRRVWFKQTGQSCLPSTDGSSLAIYASANMCQRSRICPFLCIVNNITAVRIGFAVPDERRSKTQNTLKPQPISQQAPREWVLIGLRNFWPGRTLHHVPQATWALTSRVPHAGACSCRVCHFLGCLKDSHGKPPRKRAPRF